MSANFEWILNDTYTHRANRALNFFWIGFGLYTAVYAIASAFSITSPVFQLLQLASMALFIPATIDLIQLKIESIYLRVLFILYIIWMVFAIYNGFRTNSTLIKFYLLNSDFGIFLYLVPIVLLFPKNLAFYKKTFDVITILSIICFVLTILFFRTLLNRDYSNLTSQATLESLSKNLGFAAGFLLLTYSYHSRRRQLFAIGIFVLMLLLAIFRARRGLLSMYVLVALFSYLLYLLSTKRKIIIIFFSAIVLFFLATYVTQAASSKKNKLFSFLVERGTEDTRTPVEDCFYDDMKQKDWIIGRGINADYFCPIVEEDGDIKGYRQAIETGYLQVILNGGLISLGLLLLIALPAIICGLFFSKNILSKAAAMWILIWLLSLYPANVAAFNLNYILVWLSIGICYSKFVRNLPDVLLKEYFQHKPSETTLQLLPNR